jgi:hypothetical protein
MAAEPAMKLRRLTADMVAKLFLNGLTLPDQAVNRKRCCAVLRIHSPRA